MNEIDPDDLTDEQLKRVLNSAGFQKMLAYTKLADGIEVLAEEDGVFNTMVESIRKQHTNVNSEESVREFFELFQQEVETFTEPIVEGDDESMQADDVEDVFIDEGERNNA